MSSFWRAEEKIPILQTSKSITAQNGLSFGEGNIIRLDIPANSVKFFQPRETYLKWDLKLSMDSNIGPTRLQLDSQIGAQSLIKNLRIYSSDEKGGVLLEELLDYNANVSLKYSYDTDDTLRNKRAMTEGSTAWTPQNRGTNGTETTQGANVLSNPYFKRATLTAGNSRTTWSDTDYLTCKCTMPLHSGIFSSDKVYPNLLTGLRVEIELEQADRCLRQLESVTRNNMLALNPKFDSLNGKDTAEPKTPWAQTNATDNFYIQLANSNLTPETCPLTVGEKIWFINETNDAVWSATGGSGADGYMTITQINASANASGGEGLLQIVVDAVYTSTYGHDVDDDEWFVYSESVLTPTSTSGRVGDYTINNVEMVVQELDMGGGYESDMLKRMSEGGVVGFDILSWTNYRHSQLASDIVANLRLPLQETRARSILCMPTDSTTYTAVERVGVSSSQYDVLGTKTVVGTEPQGNGNYTSRNNRGAFVGLSDNLSDYNFFYNGKLQPSRAVSTAKTSNKYSIDAMPIVENEKALVQANIPVRSVAQFNKNFIVGRSFSLNRGVENLRNSDFSLQVNYTGTAPAKGHRWFCYLYHLRRINIRASDIAVEV